MPWVDICIVLLITIVAYIGYSVGLFGAIKGFVSKILGLVTAWILTPIAQAWLEVRLGAESFLSELVRNRFPAPLEETIRMAAETARNLQEFRDSLVAFLPREVAEYLQRSLDRTPMHTVPSPEFVMETLSGEIAKGLMWAFLLILIWTIVSILIKGFLGLVFFGREGKTVVGVLDGFLGMATMTFLVVVALIIVSGLVYPIVLMAAAEGNLSGFQPLLLDSKLLGWMAGIYQTYMIPWMK
ncbi:MAG: hypothetical protein FWH28_02605 [Clostridiales bacterium]|nr:hypothetical protein [Clostridiales bacterium]